MVYPMEMESMTELSTPSSTKSLFFNTTILRRGLYVSLPDSGLKVDAKGIFQYYCDVYNAMVDILEEKNIIDKYGRAKENAQILIDMKPDELIVELAHKFIDEGLLEITDFMKIFPKAFLILPILEIASSLLNDNRIPHKDIMDEEQAINFTIPFSILKDSNPDVSIIYDTRCMRCGIEIVMTNIFGNRLVFTIISNTNALDQVLYGLYDGMMALDKLKISLFYEPSLAQKLLFSIRYNSKEED